ncbi:hypothetical protein C6501_05850 [Candidatus Poribacteria bacterium]|nr:MAG: hypothetical protein C6501_05850 [Candidatus Poribacteria bacterium]
MYRYIFANKWFISCVFLLIVFGVAGIIWIRHNIAEINQLIRETAESDQLPQQQEKRLNTKSEAEQTVDVVAEESSTFTTEKRITETTNEMEKGTVSGENHADMQEQTQEMGKAEVRVSPHGFGPYPEIPLNFPNPNIFDYPMSAKSELRHRVRVKLWAMGERPEGTTFGPNGLVYPLYRDTVYVDWSEEPILLPDGSIGRVPKSTLVGHRDTLSSIFRELLNRVPPVPISDTFYPGVSSLFPMKMEVLTHTSS